MSAGASSTVATIALCLTACGGAVAIKAPNQSPTASALKQLWNDPGSGVMRHADAGYGIAVDCAKEQGLDLPMVS